MEQPDFGKKLVEIRKVNGLTQDELAEKCKITVRTIQRIESGLVKPRAYTIKVLSDYLGVDFFEISNFTGDEVFKMNPSSNMKDSKTILMINGESFLGGRITMQAKLRLLIIIKKRE